MTAVFPVLDWEALRAEAVRHLQALLRIDTTETETLAIQYLQEQLTAVGIDTRIIEPVPGRPSIWARLAGNGSKRPLLLLSHVDVVPVEREYWSVDPFGGEIKDGYIYGRGAVDMKCMTAKQLTLFLHFARQVKEHELLLSRDLIFMAVADEEHAGKYGMDWIVQHEPELVDAAFALNEGGGYAIEMGGTRFYLCEVAQKGRMYVTLHAHGRPGHGSVPHDDNAIVHLARALDKIGRAPLPMHVTKVARDVVETLASTQSRSRQILLRQVSNPLFSETILRRLPDKDVANGFRALLHNTVSPTVLQAGTPTAMNVIPSEAHARLDVRIIPGQTAEALAEELRRRIADPRVSVEIEVDSLGHEHPGQTALFTAIQASMHRLDAHAVIVPYLFPALSDSRFLATRGVIAYGFDPMQPEAGWPQPQALAHSHDERISVSNMEFGTRVLHDIIMGICG